LFRRVIFLHGGGSLGASLVGYIGRGRFVHVVRCACLVQRDVAFACRVVDLRGAGDGVQVATRIDSAVAYPMICVFGIDVRI